MKFDIQRISKIARLSFSEAESVEMHDKLCKVFEWLDVLHTIPTDGIEPMYTPNETDFRTYRSGEASMQSNPDVVLSNAPKTGHGFVMVPKVVE